MRSWVGFVLVMAVTVAGLWVSRPPRTQPPASEPPPWTPALNRTQETGKRIFLLRCSWCHGKAGEGFGINASKLKTPPPDFTNPEFRKSHPKQAVIDWLRDKRPRPAPLCPIWRETLAPAEIETVADFVATLGT